MIQSSSVVSNYNKWRGFIYTSFRERICQRKILSPFSFFFYKLPFSKNQVTFHDEMALTMTAEHQEGFYKESILSVAICGLDIRGLLAQNIVSYL